MGDALPQPAAERPRLLAGMATGVRWLFKHRLRRSLSLTVGAINLVYTGALAVLVIYAHRNWASPTSVTACWSPVRPWARSAP